MVGCITINPSVVCQFEHETAFLQKMLKSVDSILPMTGCVPLGPASGVVVVHLLHSLGVPDIHTVTL